MSNAKPTDTGLVITNADIITKQIFEQLSGEALTGTRDALRELEGAALEVLEMDSDRPQLANAAAKVHAFCHLLDKLNDCADK